MIAKPFVQQGSASHTSERNQRSALTVIELLVVLAVIGVLIAFLMPATRTGREPARRTQCKNNLKQIGLALYSYHDTYHAFPPAYTVDADGKPLHSWRTLILPYSDQAPLYAKIDLSKPWDDPVNAEAYNTRTPNGYCCPSVPGLPTNSTTYLAVVGPNTALRPGEPTPLSEITDNKGETLLVIEVAQKHAVHWMAPQDADEQLLLSIAAEAKELPHVGGIHGAFVDGSVRFLSASTTADVLRGLITVSGNESLNNKF